MSLRDDLLDDVLDIRGIREEFGLCTITVALRTETWPADILTSGATSSTNGDTTLVPQPKVRKAGEEVAMFYGLGPADPVSGRASADIYLVDFITPSCTAGGYSVIQLLRSTTPTAAKRCLWVLTGDGIGATATTPVLFTMVNVDASKPFHTTVTLRQAPDVPL